MGYPNLRKYSDFEIALKKVGEDRLKSYLLSKGHRINSFDRNIKIIRYTLQHGPIATSKVFHVSNSYPSTILYLYGRYAEEILEEMGKDNR